MTTPSHLVGEPIGSNWAGSYTYGAARLVRPRSVDELAELVAGSATVRALGSRHSFSDLSDTPETEERVAALVTPSAERGWRDDEADGGAGVGLGAARADWGTAGHDHDVGKEPA